MPTLVTDPPPPEFEALLERRREQDLDRWDEVWDGVLHMNPPPSREHELLASRLHRILGPLADAAGLDLLGGVGLGILENNRVPDLALQRPEDAQAQWQRTVAMVVEIRSRGDDTYKKLPFYAEHQVDEVLVADLAQHTVALLRLQASGKYEPAVESVVLGVGAAELANQLGWPNQPPSRAD